MDTTETPDTYASQLQALLDNRMASGQRLAEAAATKRAAQAALEDADRDYSAAFTAALGAGWTDRELRTVFRSVGQPAPVVRRLRATSGRRRTGGAHATTEAPGQPPGHQGRNVHAGEPASDDPA
ncbi:hypothetical protein [Cellulomonas sp. Y8]|uniref:hypothetical protein n=1 Tax=Cellulomonas sp. Y8 TaxID=2591145 RepID=UPI0011CA95CF|nr:hypothetical protein [Cellulomonas sp. Y8]